MDPQKRFVKAAADMEQALADSLNAVVERDDFCPEQLERILRLITKKEIILSFLLDDVHSFHFKPKKRKFTYSNTNPIWIPAEGTRGPANPYPSTIQVSGLKGLVKKVTVKFRHLYHTFPRDISAMLVGPDEQNLLIMSLAGGSFNIENVTLKFDDDATSQLSEFDQIESGTYQPTSYGRFSFPAPAPTPSTNTHLSIFKGINPNGIWELYVQDIFSQDTGVMAGGWEITITTEDPKTGKTYTNTFNQIEEEQESEDNELMSDHTLFTLDMVDEDWKNNNNFKAHFSLLKEPRSKNGQEAESNASHPDRNFPGNDT